MLYMWSVFALQVNESFKSGHSGVYLISYEEFYVPDLREKVDLRKDFVAWLRFSGSTVITFVLICANYGYTNQQSVNR